MKRSLGNRLLLILLLATGCVWVAASVGIWVLGTAAIERQIDNQLRTLVLTVSYTVDAFATAGFPGGPHLSLLDFEVIDSNDGAMYMVQMPDDALPMVLNVWLGDVIRAMTKGSPVFAPPHVAGIEDNTLPDGSEWRVIRSRLGETDLWLVAGLNKELLATESKRLLLAVLSPLLLGLLVIVPLIYYAVRKGLKPLHELEQQIAQRSSSDLHAVEAEDIPAEVAPMVNALNRLLQQLGAAIEKEKRITADAAHELQTPLASIKTEVQLALNHSPGTDKALLLRIIERVNRASHAVKQLTALSRLESTAQAFTQQVDLHAIAAQVLDSHAAQIATRRLQVATNDCHPHIQGNTDMIAILLDNLIRNALNHASAGTQVLIALSENGGTEFLVENDCADISHQEWALITQRFYRVPGSQGDGSGLGMSIAQRICELHGAALTVGKRASGDGFSVRVVFAAAGGDGASSGYRTVQGAEISREYDAGKVS
jgi:signal transduction histidine kinase